MKLEQSVSNYDVFVATRTSELAGRSSVAACRSFRESLEVIAIAGNLESPAPLEHGAMHLSFRGKYPSSNPFKGTPGEVLC